MTRVRMEKTVRAPFGNYYKGLEYDLPGERSSRWIKSGKCAAVESRRPRTRRRREAAVTQAPETAMEETTHDASE